MGTEFSVCCRDCKVRRDLDKFYALYEKLDSRAAALAMVESGYKTYNAALLLTFMGEHMGHNVTVLSEHDDGPENDYPKEKGRYFWNEHLWDEGYVQPEPPQGSSP